MKHIVSRIRRAFSGWAGADAGSVALVFVFAMPVLFAAAGMTVDLAQAYNVKMRLSNAIDKAALAAGSTDGTTAQVTARINKFFLANYPATKLGVPSDLSISLGDGTVTVSATASVPTIFMAALGQDSIQVSADTTVKREVAGLEIVLVMDNTGSMADSAGGGVSKISAAKTAANTLVSTLFGPSSNVPVLWMGVVPFSQAVNVGSSRTSWTTTTSLNWGTTSWMGCVMARQANNRDVTDDPPSVALFDKYYSPCSSSTGNTWYGTNSSKNNCTSGSGVKYQTLSTTLGPNRYCPQALLPMTNSQTTVTSAINSMQAVGSTMIDLGMAWGWRMLSPRWRGVWGGTMNTNNLPLDYNTPKMNKVVILMTDGDNSFDANNFTAYDVLSAKTLGTNNNSTANTILNTRTLSVCSSMKADNIIIYTIALGQDLNSTSLAMLKSCASKSSNYFQSPTTNDLQAAFTAIAAQLNSLHITN